MWIRDNRCIIRMKYTLQKHLEGREQVFLIFVAPVTKP